MPSEKKNVSLKSAEYEIDGNSVRAFYDANGKLVFVLDLTTSDIKPNVLLVMMPVGNRKWDDVLANDYGLNLENVRPKKDNKYQKLDVEYNGLAVYDNLIRAYENDEDLDKYMDELSEFRMVASRNSATERMNVARAIADNARETIDKTSDTIVELQAKIKAARSKITILRRGIGREPTKESAAKILKAEATLDTLNDKLARAQKRLENANKRLMSAQDDMDAARAVLDLLPRGRGNKKYQTVSTLVAPVVTAHDDVDVRNDAATDDDMAPDLDEKTENDADYDMVDDDSGIKPLFDKDPNILDDKIAFKPIDFGMSGGTFDVTDTDENLSDDDTNVGEILDEVIDENVGMDTDDSRVNDTDDIDDTNKDNAPDILFEPPRAIMDAVKLPDEYDAGDVKLDNVFSESLDENPSYDTASTVDLAPNTSVEVVAMDNVSTDDVPKVETVADVRNDAPAIKLDAVSRPVAPVGKTQNVVREDIPTKQSNTTHKPGFLYYVLLLVLIALSVFTLWLYHRSNVSSDAVPTVVAESVPVVANSDVRTEDEMDEANPFIASGDVAAPAQSILPQVVENSLDKIADVADAADAESASDADITDDLVNENLVPDMDAVPVMEPVVEPVTDVASVVDKPEYNVSQENVFTNGDTSGGNLCAGDVAPDANGCCPRETYSTVNGQKVCCPDDGMDCYPPLF